MIFVPRRKMMPAQMNQPTRANTIPVTRPESPPPREPIPEATAERTTTPIA
jgi:hypothetical protein